MMGTRPGGIAALLLTAAALVLPETCAAWRLTSVRAQPAVQATQDTAHPACSARNVRALRLTRLAGTRARLSWSGPSGARGQSRPVYRVLRAGLTVGQTTRASIVLRITPGRLTTYTVQARFAGAGPTCSATLRTVLALRPPGPVTVLRVLASTSSGALLGWRAAARGDAPIVGYRVERDNAVVGQTRRLQFALRVSSGRSNRITVAAVDTLGHLGPSAVLVIGARAGLSASPAAPARPASAPAAQPPSTHPAPNPPSLLSAVKVSDTSITLSWEAGSANGGASVAGYLLFEDGQPVGVVQGQITTVAVASEREYTFAVRTMDSYGDLSEPTPELTVLTTHTPPPAPTGLTASEVTSQSARLRWSPSTAVSGTIVGYRVFRDEIPVGQTTATQMTVADLAPSSEYQLSVSAVDSLNAISQPATLTIHTSLPPPTHGSVQAYVLASTDESFEDLVTHYQQIGVVYPTYFECGERGHVLGSDDQLLTHWALERKIEVLPRLNCQNLPYEEQILNEPTVREKMIERLVSLCETYGYQGVQIDFEGAPPSEREPFTTFITMLAQRLHAQGDKLSTVVTAKYYNVPTGRAAMYNDAALSGPSDYMFVLDWGIHWTTSTPGSIDELSWFKRVAEYTATLPNREKFVLGMPLYGVNWPEGGGPEHPGTAMEYQSIMALAGQLGITPEWEAAAASPHFSYTENGVGHEVWYVDRQSLQARAEVAGSLGLKIGLWRLGTEDQSIWELPQLGGEG